MNHVVEEKSDLYENLALQILALEGIELLSDFLEICEMSPD